jgi:membrane protease YdiL (CAAX protease family)
LTLEEKSNQPKRILAEILFVLFIAVIPGIFFTQLKAVCSIIPVVYFFVERRLRKRSWEEVGFNFKGLWDDLKANWHLILLVSIVIQVAASFSLKHYWPEMLEHITGRLPIFNLSNVNGLVIMLLIATAMEEIVYRGLFQGRLSLFINTWLAIAIVSVLFGLAHYSTGNVLIVTVDIVLVILDSLLYGIIFARTRNIIVSWTAHLLADVVALISIVLL